jgi:hypothetical protein
MFAALIALICSGIALFRDQEDSLGDRLEELQTHAIARVADQPRRRDRGLLSEKMEFIYPELAAGFATVVMQMKAGQERLKAFQQLVWCTGIEDSKALSAMIVQSERFGAGLSLALKSMRTHCACGPEAQSEKAGIKMLFFILPALFVITLVPGILTVFQDLRQGLGPRSGSILI